MTKRGDTAVDHLARALEERVPMYGRHDDSRSLAMLIDALVETRIAEAMQRARMGKGADEVKP